MKSIFFVFLFSITFTGCYHNDELLDEDEKNIKPNIPFDFPEIIIPDNNPITASKVELGRYLFYDNRFSSDYSISCGSCHHQQVAFSDQGKSKSIGSHGTIGKRNAPTLTNVAYNTRFFAEGGVPSLELQAIAPIIDPLELNINTDTLVNRLKKDQSLKAKFKKAWGDESISIERITKSISTFERMLISSNSSFDKWKRGNDSAISQSAKRGFEIFFGEKGECFHCHNGFNFTDNDFHNTSLDSITIDEGRFRVTSNNLDMAKFKTPTLRNIELTFPYMHDGRFTTLEQVINHYNSGGKNHPNSDAIIKPLYLSEQEKTDLVEFLKTLTDSEFINNSSFSNPNQ